MQQLILKTVAIKSNRNKISRRLLFYFFKIIFKKKVRVNNLKNKSTKNYSFYLVNNFYFNNVSLSFYYFVFLYKTIKIPTNWRCRPVYKFVSIDITCMIYNDLFWETINFHVNRMILSSILVNIGRDKNNKTKGMFYIL